MTNDIDESKAPLLDHLIELRKRLIRCAIAIVVLFLGCFFVAEEIYNFLAAPLAEQLADRENARMIFTALHEVFFTQVKVAFFAALFISFPFVANQLWMFIAPGLYKNEKKAFLPFLVLTPILFFAGGALVYYMIFPLAWQFFLGFETIGGDGALAIQLEAKVDEYLSLVMKLIFAFGLSFELPLVLTLMARVGMTTADGLAEKRKYAIVGAFVAAAVLTPPDPISQISLAIPIILLYEVSIISVRMVEKRRKQRDDESDAAAGIGKGDADEPVDETDFNVGR
ncbi:MAG: twin-arginine translocase subunit TatC [Proteobacteria bacterium]|nr:twin-arginine translocase subunit TatC [Pseudomonadota bacterium]